MHNNICNMTFEDWNKNTQMDRQLPNGHTIDRYFKFSDFLIFFS